MQFLTKEAGEIHNKLTESYEKLKALDFYSKIEGDLTTDGSRTMLHNLAQHKDARAFYQHVKDLQPMYEACERVKKLEPHVAKEDFAAFSSATVQLFEPATAFLTAQTTLTTLQCLMRPLTKGETRANLAARAKALQTKQKCGKTLKIPSNLDLLVNAMMSSDEKGPLS